MLSPIWWKDNKVNILDQTLLPIKERVIVCKGYKEVVDCIKRMNIRGAPAIGISAGYALAIGALKISSLNKNAFFRHLNSIAKNIRHARPTAVNLSWSVDRLLAKAHSIKGEGLGEIKRIILEEAITIHKEDLKMNLRIGEHGARLFRRSVNVLTHCNTGSLATGGYGTALGIVRSLHKKKMLKKVFVDETRPFLQGARLTAWELKKDRIPFILICDNMAGFFMAKGLINAVLVGADRIAANGDVANKIGTYTLAILAREHHIPFYVAAPSSTVDYKTPRGDCIKIEWRDKREVTHIRDRQVSPSSIKVENPAFDITPNKYIKAIITEQGILYPPYRRSIKSLRNNQ